MVMDVELSAFNWSFKCKLQTCSISVFCGVTAALRLAPLMPPVGVDAVMLSATAVLVSWSDTQDSGGPGSSVYTVRCGLRGRYRYVNVTLTSARLDQLRPHSDYECSVRVSRARRHSTWSMTVLVTTDQAGIAFSSLSVAECLCISWHIVMSVIVVDMTVCLCVCV